jgi:hypothetical protein
VDLAVVVVVPAVLLVLAVLEYFTFSTKEQL